VDGYRLAPDRSVIEEKDAEQRMDVEEEKKNAARDAVGTDLELRGPKVQKCLRGASKMYILSRRRT